MYMHDSQYSLPATASRLLSHVAGDAYLELEKMKTVATGLEICEGERRQRQNLGNKFFHDGVMVGKWPGKDPLPERDGVP